ncbi:MAG: radical SAM protein [Patescibacteria group bacterium]|nr:radical SAM protein [Patescibacteria group bacterium]
MRQNKYSDFKIVAFPEKLRSFAEGKISAPIYVRVKPINLCDHSCFFCCYSTGFRKGDRDNHIHSGMHEDMHERDVMPTSKMMEVLEDFRDIGVKAVTYSGGGEPLLHRDIVEIMQRTLDYGIDLSIITNGQMLVKRRAAVLAHAKWVRVSIDYTDGAQMAASRNVPSQHFDMIMANLENFARIKDKSCDLAVNYIIHRENYKGIAAFAKQLKDCGVENVRFSPMWNPDFVAYHAPIAEKVREQLAYAANLVDDNFNMNTTYKIDAAAHSPKRSYHKCLFMQTVPVVGADQVVYACHNKAYDKSGVIGSIKNRRFRDLWFSDEAKAVFEGLDPAVSCRHQCANDQKNILIHQMLDASTDNFV